MSDDADRVIEHYLKRIERLLPSGFETNDLIEDLREHILQSYGVKIEKRPSENRIVLINEILEELGTPEDIAEEQTQAIPKDLELKDKRSRRMYVLGRLAIAIVVVIIATAFVVFYTGGELDFGFTLTVLLVFVIAEWFLRAWRAGETSPFGLLESD